MAYQGHIIPQLLGLQAVSRPNGEQIHAAIEETVKTYAKLPLDSFYQKLMALGSDGASVMVGEGLGVTGRLKEKQALLIVSCNQLPPYHFVLVFI